MDKKQGLFFDVLNIVTLAAISYISAFTGSEYSLVVLISASVAAAVFTMVTENKSVLYLMFGFVCFIFACFIGNSDINAENCFDVILRALDLYLPAFAISLCFRRKNADTPSTVAYASMANIIVLLLSLAKIKFYNNIDLHKQLESVFNEIINQYSELISSNSALIGINPTMLSKSLETAKQALIMMLPSLMIIASMVCAYFVIVVSRSLINVHSRSQALSIEYFADLHIDNKLCKVSIVLLVIALFSENLYLTAGIYNFLAVAVAIYFADGLAIVNYIAFSKTNNRPLSLLITVAVAVAAFTTVATLPIFNGMTILFLLGVLDSGRDFRKIMKARWKDEQK